MIKIYIASPYSIGDKIENVNRQILLADGLINQGFCPHVPLLKHYQHIQYPQSYGTWLKQDIEWLKCCDVLLRLQGESKGADYEVEKALEFGIPVAYSMVELFNFCSNLVNKSE